MNISETLQIFEGIPASTESGLLSVVHMCENIYFAKSESREPCLLVLFRDPKHLPGGRSTRGLSLEFYPDVVVSGARLDCSGPVGLLRCRELGLAYVFAVMCLGLLVEVEKNPGAFSAPQALVEYVEDWQELLSRRRALSFEEQLGLWGELWFIRTAPNPHGALAAWFGPAGKRFDFSANGVDLDVKTSLRGHQHQFSLAQLQPSPSNSERYIYSLCIEDDPSGGLTLSDLVDAIGSLLSNPVELGKQLVGLAYETALESLVRYSVTSTALYSTTVIPRVTHWDSGVSKIRFEASLVDCPQLSPAATVVLLTRLTGASA